MRVIARLHAIHGVKAPNPVLGGNPVREMVLHQPVQHPIQCHSVDIQTAPFHGVFGFMMGKCRCTTEKDFQHGQTRRCEAAVGCPQQFTRPSL